MRPLIQHCRPYLRLLPSGVSKTFSFFSVSMSLSFSRLSSSEGGASEMALVTPYRLAVFFWPSMVEDEGRGWGSSVVEMRQFGGAAASLRRQSQSRRVSAVIVVRGG
jgi:hypothetical protein